MKYCCFFLLVLLSLNGFAQTYSMHDYEVRLMDYVPFRYVPEDEVSQITFAKLNKKKEVLDTYIKTYNKAGDLTSYESINKKSELIKEVTFSYNESDQMTNMTRKKKGKLKRRIDFTYTTDEKPLSHIKYDGSGTIRSKVLWKWDDTGCLKEYIWYKKGGEKVKKKWIHEYRADCDRSKSTVYNGKGKLLNVWTYDCKEEGEKLVKKKNETQVCRWEEVDVETITKVYQTFDEKGKIVKNVSKYTAGDTLILEWARYDENDQLLHKSTYDKDEKKLLRSTSFKRGKEWYDTQIIYENGRVISNRRSRNGNLYGLTEYTYNEDGMLGEYVSFRGNGNVYDSYSMTYVK